MFDACVAYLLFPKVMLAYSALTNLLFREFSMVYIHLGVTTVLFARIIYSILNLSCRIYHNVPPPPTHTHTLHLL